MAESEPNEVTLVRIEGMLARMSDKIELTGERVEALLDVVTGSKSGAQHGLVVRVHTLERRVGKIEDALGEITEVNARLDSLERKLDTALKMQTDHPPLLYLLRFQTRKTLFWIVVIFIIFSLWWVSGLRQPILEFLGLPVF